MMSISFEINFSYSSFIYLRRMPALACSFCCVYSERPTATAAVNSPKLCRIRGGVSRLQWTKAEAEEGGRRKVVKFSLEREIKARPTVLFDHFYANNFPPTSIIWENIIFEKFYIFIVCVGGEEAEWYENKKKLYSLNCWQIYFHFHCSLTNSANFFRSLCVVFMPFSHFISFYMSVKNDEHITHKQQQKKNASRKASTASARELLITKLSWVRGFCEEFQGWQQCRSALSHKKKKEEKKKQHKPEQSSLKTLEKSDMPRKLCVTSYKGSKSVVVIIKNILITTAVLPSHIASSSSHLSLHIIQAAARKSRKIKKNARGNSSCRNNIAANTLTWVRVKMKIVFRL